MINWKIGINKRVCQNWIDNWIDNWSRHIRRSTTAHIQTKTEQEGLTVIQWNVEKVRTNVPVRWNGGDKPTTTATKDKRDKGKKFVDQHTLTFQTVWTWLFLGCTHEQMSNCCRQVQPDHQSTLSDENESVGDWRRQIHQQCCVYRPERERTAMDAQKKEDNNKSTKMRKATASA